MQAQRRIQEVGPLLSQQRRNVERLGMSLWKQNLNTSYPPPTKGVSGSLFSLIAISHTCFVFPLVA